MVRSTCALAVLVLGVGAGALGQPCGARWSNPTPPPDVAGSVFTLTVLDDDGPGPHGPALYAAGLFTSVSGQAAGNIAKWDGAAWTPVGGAGTNGAIFAMAAFDDDGPGPHGPALYVAGNFSTAGGMSAPYIARWDGTNWSAVGPGLDGPSGARALVVFDDDGPGPHNPALYAGGYFTTSGATAVANVAKWDGAAWAAVGGGTDDGVTSLVVFDDDGSGSNPASLYAGGLFAAAGGVAASRIARWDGSAWHDVGGGIGGDDPFEVDSLAVFDADGSGPGLPALYVGGSFGSAGTTPAADIARWDGSAWSALVEGLTGGPAPIVAAIATFDDDGAGPHAGALYAAGRFTTAGTGAALNVARWDGSAWSALGSGVDSVNAFVSAIAEFAGPAGPAELVVGGDMTSCGGVAVSNIGKWNGAAWNGLATDLRIIGAVSAMVAMDEDGTGPGGPALFVGGSFTRAANVVASNIARKNGGKWSALGLGTDGPVYAMACFEGKGAIASTPGLVVGGGFAAAGGSPASRVALWNGAAWSALGPGVNGNVYAAAVYDDDGPGPDQPTLYIGGDFTLSGATAVSRIARWDGANWVPVGLGIGNGSVRALTVYDADGLGPGNPLLAVGGDFTTAGGSSANRAAIWNGSAWSAMGTGLSGGAAPMVEAWCVLDETPFGNARRVLVAGGMFTLAGGSAASRVVRWDGLGWSALGTGVTGGSTTDIKSLAVFDEDGPGAGAALLYAGGQFFSPDRGIARWNGAAWSAVGPGIAGLGTSQPVAALAAIDRDRAGPIAPALQAGGSFGLRTWSACDAACPGDFDRNGLVQPADVTLFVGAWFADLTAGGVSADFDNNGIIEPQDIAAFVRVWFGNLLNGC